MFFFSCAILSWYIPDTMAKILLAYKAVFIWMGISLLFFILSLAVVYRLVAGLSSGYFMDLAADVTPGTADKGSWAGKMTVRVLKNALGLVLVFAGIVMLFVPGQGVLTILAGMVMLEFPGKKKVVVFMVGQGAVQNGLNWIRRKKGVPPLIFPGKDNG